MGYINHNLHVPWFEFDQGHDLKLLYILQTIKVFVDKFALFFLPIFLYGQAQSWNVAGPIEQNGAIPWWVPVQLLTLTDVQLGMLLIAVFFIVYRFSVLVCAPLVGIMLQKYGNRLSLTLGYGAFGLSIVSLHAAILHPIFIFTAAIFQGISVAFTLIIEPAILAENALKSNIGKDIGLGRFLMQLANMSAPMLGGLVIVYLGYQSLFLIGLGILVILLLILQGISGKKVKHTLQMEDARYLLKNRSFQSMIVSSIGRYFNDVGMLLWPVYLFALLGSVDKVGFLYAASFFFAMLASMIGGVQIDMQKTKKPYFGSGAVLAGLWIVRIYVFNPLSIAFVDALDRLVANYHWMYFETSLLKAARTKNPVIFLVLRTMVISAASICTWIGIAILFVFVIESWKGLFVMAAVGVLSSLLIQDSIRYKD